MTDKERIEEFAKHNGFTVLDWREDPDDGLIGVLGRFRVIEEDEDRGLYADDEGELSACVVGAEKYGNQRVALSFTADGYDAGNDVRDPSLLEEI